MVANFGCSAISWRPPVRKVGICGSPATGSRVYLGLDTRRAADDAQPHTSLGHERITIRQERQTEWMHQPSGDDGDFQPVLLGRIEGVGSGAQRHRGDADLRLPLLGREGH